MAQKPQLGEYIVKETSWTTIQGKPAVSIEEVFMGEQATRWHKGEVRREKEPNWGFEK